MKHIIYGLIFTVVFITDNTSGKEVYISININDCVNCYTSMYLLKSQIPDQKVHFVFESDYKEDAALLIEKIGVDQFKHNTVIFSDSLYKEISKGFGSTIAIVDDEITPYRQNLKSLNIEELLYFLNGDCCFKKLLHKKSVISVLDDSSIISKPNGLGRIEYIKDESIIPFSADTNLLRNCYKAYYGGDAYQIPYLNITSAITEFPNFSPELIDCIKKDDSTLAFTVGASFMKFSFGEINGKYDTIIDIFKRYFIQQYDLKAKRYPSCYYIDDKEMRKLGYAADPKLALIEGKYMFAVSSLDSNPNPKYLAEFGPSADPDRIEFKQFSKINIPENYTRYNILGDFLQPLFSKHLVVLIFGNVIHDFVTGTAYEIPIADTEYESLENIKERLMNRDKADRYFRISAIRDARAEIELLYKNRTDELVYLRFSKANPKLKSSKVLIRNLSRKGITSISFFKDKDYICYFDKRKGCVVVVRV